MQDSVPRALVEALIAPQFQMVGMMGVGGGRPRVVVGALPSGLAQRLWIPPGATVLGGLESSGAGVGIIRSGLSKDSLMAMYRREQPVRGWAAPPERRFSPLSGFVPAPGSASDPNEALIFCSGGTVLVIAIAPTDGVQEIRAQAIAIGQSVCDPPRPEPADRFGRAYYPTLINPPGTGAGMATDCVRWNSSGGGGSTKLSTAMTLDQVFAHYGRQLADSGWSAIGDQQIVARTWMRLDSAGTFVEMTLIGRIRAAAPRCVELETQVNAHRPP